jgi:hypothetical protein
MKCKDGILGISPGSLAPEARNMAQDQKANSHESNTAQTIVTDRREIPNDSDLTVNCHGLVLYFSFENNNTQSNK